MTSKEKIRLGEFPSSLIKEAVELYRKKKDIIGDIPATTVIIQVVHDWVKMNRNKK